MTSNSSKFSFVAAFLAVAALTSGEKAFAQMAGEIPPILVTPDKVESSIGTLEFKDGAPSAETVKKVRDTLDFTRALDKGTFALQAHDPKSKVFFRNIRVKRLP